jgi:hypothetical protein
MFDSGPEARCVGVHLHLYVGYTRHRSDRQEKERQQKADSGRPDIGMSDFSERDVFASRRGLNMGHHQKMK